ncbi:uncharacterized protein BDZ99DRAFT_570540 [Mytilinidion resinicola]|uniref:Uncharacterized protein n=1 Tax=Mytilinidion resinicola TaxID=574789 RepID=A0A6A6YLY8_9PEZI|nr:uncharacterized protein BDZ99DRAFT_570540 [Mytilinidion resinicola]KAF2809892.1 hypothetical protein BDZ99DRAFT_570540 [Mytilinidion resinicola]
MFRATRVRFQQSDVCTPSSILQQLAAPHERTRWSILINALMELGNGKSFLAVLPSITPRALPPGCDEAYKDIALVELNDGPTTSGDAGIGAEFETLQIQFSNNQCSLADTFSAKRKTVQGRSGTNFVLSVDTSVEQGKGKLSAEYVLDGRNIRVGDGSAAAAGRAAHDDLASWTPWSENPQNQVTIENYQQCNPWAVRGLNGNTNKDQIWWAPQITASMPSEALYSLMKENVQGVTNGRNVLNGDTGINRGQNIQLVTEDYFKDLSLKVDVKKINDAVLGFCTLVLSYAKAANKLNLNDPNTQEMSPKSWIPFMPRTEFVTIYSAVKSFFPADNELFDIFNTLACYKTGDFTNDNFQVSIDSDYCTGTVENPVPGDKFGGLQYKYIGNFPKQGIPTTLSIKEWIQDIDQGSPSPDLLTTFDQQYDGSIGGLGTQVEKMFNLDRTAPLFEFRDLVPQLTADFENFMGDVDSSIQALHKNFAARLMKKVKRDASACPFSTAAGPTSTPPASPTTTPPAQPSCVVQDTDPGLGITSEGCICQESSTWPALSTSSGATYSAQCAYTAPPSNSAQATITQAPMKPQTNSQACLVCTPQPNFEDDCTSMPSCNPQTAYATATVNSSPVHYGTLSQDALFTGISTALKAACSSITTGKTTVSGTATPTVSCNKDNDYTINNQLPYESDGFLANDGTLSINVGSYAATADQVNALLAVASSMVTKSANSSEKSCHIMHYQEPIIKPRGILGRSLSLGLPFLFARSDHPVPTFSSMRVCNGPAVVVASYWAPGYRDRIGSGNKAPSPDAQLTATLKFTKGADGDFFCEVVAELAGAILTEAAPELAELDIFEAEQIQAACEELNQ